MRIASGSPRAGLRAWGLAVLLALGAVPAVAPDASAQNPFRGRRLYVEPRSEAHRQADAWRRSRPQDAERIRRMADQPKAIWLGDWNRSIQRETEQLVGGIVGAGAYPVLVAYNIPNRDCGLYSAGGARGADDYRRWIRGLADGIRRRPTAVILEPDGLSTMDCLPLRIREERFGLIREAVSTLKGQGAAVYIDAGTATWHRPEEMASRLQRAGIQQADGFALNVSNFVATPLNIQYGERLSRLVGGKHFIIDTSRNGAGVTRAGNWCNARGQALGRTPTTSSGHPLVDALLWVKTPGQSDGTCNGGPQAGKWWGDYALELARAAEAIAGTLPR